MKIIINTFILSSVISLFSCTILNDRSSTQEVIIEGYTKVEYLRQNLSSMVYPVASKIIVSHPINREVIAEFNTNDEGHFLDTLHISNRLDSITISVIGLKRQVNFLKPKEFQSINPDTKYYYSLHPKTELKNNVVTKCIEEIKDSPFTVIYQCNQGEMITETEH